MLYTGPARWYTLARPHWTNIPECSPVNCAGGRGIVVERLNCGGGVTGEVTGGVGEEGL